MAKKENRQIFGLECSICRNQNYISSKNWVNVKDKVTLNKYCKKCRKSTSHQEFKLGK